MFFFIPVYIIIPRARERKEIQMITTGALCAKSKLMPHFTTYLL